MEFIVTMKVTIADANVDIVGQFENAVMDRFAGTAIKVSEMTVMPNPPDPKPADLVPPALRGQLTEADWQFLHMMRGSEWGPGAQVTLPSGLLLSGFEVASLLPKE